MNKTPEQVYASIMRFLQLLLSKFPFGIKHYYPFINRYEIISSDHKWDYITFYECSFWHLQHAITEARWRSIQHPDTRYEVFKKRIARKDKLMYTSLGEEELNARLHH